MIQRIRLYDRNAGAQVQSLVRELDPASMPQLNVLHTAVKTWNSLNQIKSFKKKDLVKSMSFIRNIIYKVIRIMYVKALSLWEFRAVLGSQQNWGEGTEISHAPLPSSCNVIPLSRSFSRWDISCNSWIYIDSSLLPQVHNLFTLGFTLGILWVWKMHSHVYPSLWYQSTFVILQILCTLPTHLSSLQPLATTRHLTISMFCLF